MVQYNEMLLNDNSNDRIELNELFHNQNDDNYIPRESLFNQTNDNFNQSDYFFNPRDNFFNLTDDFFTQNFFGFNQTNDYINGSGFPYSRDFSFDSRENLINQKNDIILEEDFSDASYLSHISQEKNIKDENKSEKENPTKNQQNNLIIYIENENSNSTIKEISFKSKETVSKNKSKEKKKILGRKSNKEKALKQEDPLHGIYSEDNILVKVQTHYINFIISLLNCILPLFNYNKTLFNLDQKFKINIKKNNKSLNDKTIGEIISNKISEKYKTKADKINSNKNICEEIKNYPIINNILSENSSVFFKKFYYRSDSKINLKDYGLDKDITFTTKVKNFKHLLNANEKRGTKYIRSIKEFTQRNYLPGLKFICH